MNFSSDRDHRSNVIFLDLCSGCNCDKMCYVLALRVMAIPGLTPKKSKNIPNFRPTYTVCSQLQKT
jgi:hypothetical protein